MTTTKVNGKKIYVYKYEKDSENKHDLKHRQASPYRSFCTPNFLINKEVMLNHPLMKA